LSNGETVHELSKDGIALWDSFVEKGLAKKLGEKNYIFLSNNINESESERKLGKSLAEQIPDKFVMIYRACPKDSNTFKDRDYVTRSKKFAIEHAENNHVYHEEQQHVLYAFVPTKYVFDAYNPGEYFYSGPEVKGKEIYLTKGDEYEGLDESIKNNFKINKFVYHKSNPLYRNDIIKNGLKPKRGEQWLSNTQIKGNAIFATNSENKEDWFDSNYDDDIWKISTENLSNKWLQDPNYERDTKHVFTQENIPPKYLTLFYKGTGASYK
jgi:hypothetical protein